MPSKRLETCSLSCRSETGGGTIDRHEQGGAHLFAAPGPMLAQQVHLLATDLVDGFQPAREAPPELREALGDAGVARDAQDHLAGQPILLFDAREDWFAHGRVLDQPGVLA